MPGRHFAYFRQGDGRCVGEAIVPVRWLGVLRLAQALGWCWLANRWATAISRPPRGTIGLDVTYLGLPVGDFVWAHFDAIDRRLSFPAERLFLTVDRATGFITGNTITGRPVRFAHPAYDVVDVTGLGLANDGPFAQGYLRTGEDGALQVEPYVAPHCAAPQLEAPRIDDELLDLPVRDAELVGVTA